MLQERDLWNKVGFRSANWEKRRENVISVYTNPAMLTKAPQPTEN
jgi:hypothetical protein